MEPQVLDLAQLVRIQGTHRGFLYQHLYAAACLLSSPKTSVVRVRVERDEDVELVHPHQVIYAQIKTRKDLLAPSDIEGLLERFDAIRATHQTGERKGAARFALVSNTELGPTLATIPWPSDVVVITPTTAHSVFESTGLVAPHSTIDALLRSVQAVAEGFRLSALRPESLIAKLVGVIALAAAGERPENSFATVELDRLCELVAAQLWPLPRVATYRPQHNEPTLPEGRSSLVVLGHAGDGKSAWAAEAAAHASDVSVYLPCSSAPGEQLAPRLVDAAVTTLVANGNLRPFDLVLPGRSGIDALALLDKQLTTRGISLMAIVDDCHHAPAAMVVDAMRAAPSIRWLLLGRPSAALNEVAASMSLPREVLGGWDDDVIAAVLHDAGCSTQPTEVAALRSATKGAPLFVLQAVQAISKEGKDTGNYARSLLAGTTAGQTPQETLLEGAAQALEGPVARVSSALAAIDIGLRGDEWAMLLEKSVGDDRAVIRRALRALVEQQIAYVTQREVVAIHDAFRPLLDGRFLSKEETRRVRECTADLLRTELLDERASERIVAYVRVLASLGQLSQLADVANALSEWCRETGTIGEVRGHLEAALRQGALTPEDQFWALDTLAFFDVEDNDPDMAAGRIPGLARLAAGLDDNALYAVQHKRVLVALLRGEVDTVRKLLATLPADLKYARILRYHAALAEAAAGEVPRAVVQLLNIAGEYLAELGLTPNTMLGRNPAELRALMGPNVATDDIRHLADCYAAIVQVTSKSPAYRETSALPAVWSMKFYDLAGATRSALRAGRETVEAMLDLWDDPDAARSFIETSLLPAVARAKLPEMTIPIRSQYAVVCAHCGDFTRADALMAALAPYAGGLSPDGRAELENQQDLIEQLRARGPVSRLQLATRRRRITERNLVAEQMCTTVGLGPPSSPATPPTRKVGRNEPCPCGSGQKYKKCCGALS